MMKHIDKKACRDFLEPVCPPNSDCGLFLIPKLRYIVRTAIKIVGHRRLLILCLYATGIQICLHQVCILLQTG